MLLYNIAKFIANVIFRLVFFIDVKGKKNIPKEGRIILCFNHISNLDPVILGMSLPRQIHYMAKKELFQNKILGKIVRMLGAFPVDRKSADLSAIRAALKVLKNEDCLGIFPEGTRVREEKIDNAKPGIALISIKGKAPIVPIFIKSKYKPFSRVTIIIGEPMYLNEFDGKKLSTDEYKALSQKIMKTIYSLKNKY
jgi:1-acyl-sn-glycerol-3-phosphate acyltransferase